MAAELWKIAGGTIYDPANGIDGQVGDLWIEGPRIVSAPTDPAVRPARVLDARGLVVMPGGVDLHCHIAGAKVNAARRMLPEDRRDTGVARRNGLRSGTGGAVPSSYITGYRYAALGYTTAFDAAIAPLMARAAHLELADMPCIDRGCFLLVGNNHYLLRAIQAGDAAAGRDFLAWLLQAAKGYALKLVNPGGVEAWKQGCDSPQGLDAPLDGFGVTPRQIVTAVADAADQLRLPHPVHIHCPQLGLPGNWKVTLETMKAVEGLRGHFTHVQFHSYAGGQGDEETFGSAVQPLAEHVNAHDQLTVDVGQVLFGRTTSMTGDSAAADYLSRLYGRKHFFHDVELEGGCGIVPIQYKQKNVVHAWQWTIGLEWFLTVDDPWRIALSTDHPNGGSFLAYPWIIRLLMDRAYRDEAFARLPARVRRRSPLRGLDRQYSLGEICIITRAGPARILGLANKGHLGPGADADVTLYTPDDDWQRMFELPRHVIQRGRLIVEDGQLRQTAFGRTLWVSPPHDPDRQAYIARWFDEHYSLRFANYAITEDELAEVGNATAVEEV